MNGIATAILVAFAAWGAGCASTQEYFQDAGAPPRALGVPIRAVNSVVYSGQRTSS